MRSFTNGLKRLVQRKLIDLGYDVHEANWQYRPWQTDQAFLAVYQAIRTHTLVDVYRCYELWTLVEQSKKLDGCLVEVGVWRGGTGALLAKRAQLCGIKDPVYLCDTFTGVVKTGALDSHYRGGEHADTSRQTVARLISARLKLDNVRILEGIFPEQTAHLIAETAIRLCHVDVDVYQSARDCAEWAWPRLVVGGMVIYDDYGFTACAGVTRYVEEQRLAADRLVIHNLNGHAIVVKLRP